MTIKGKIIHKKLLTGFDIYNTLFSGQSFRWNHIDRSNKFMYGIIDHDLLLIEHKKNSGYTLITTNKTVGGKNIDDFVRHYFSLDTDVNALFPRKFKARFPEIWTLVQPYLGVKILRQDVFETLITFMCAQGLGMQVIRKQVTYLAREFGKKHAVTMNNKPLIYYSFPSPESLAAANPESLGLCTNNNRIRANNIIAAAKSITSGRLDLEALKDPHMPLEHIRKTLCVLPGIGPKIADCIMLFGLHRFSAFPIDTHVRQYLAAWFSVGDALQSLTQKHYLFLQEQAAGLLNPELAGFAGHILFHCWRKKVKQLYSY